jgi:hypothetical protein
VGVWYRVISNTGAAARENTAKIENRHLSQPFSKNMEITQDITQALRDTENSLRDFIAVVLRAKLGESWLENCGISSERLEKWKERKAEEEKRQESGVVEQRLIYYADFYDLRTILKNIGQESFLMHLVTGKQWKSG